MKQRRKRFLFSFNFISINGIEKKNNPQIKIIYDRIAPVKFIDNGVF